MLLETHVHTWYSHEKILFYGGVDPPERVVKHALRHADALFITDHDTMAGYERVKHMEGVFPGEEVTTTHGHILALGIQEPIPRYLSPEETVDRIREQGGIVVIPHPFGLKQDSLRWKVRDIKPDAVEVFNALNMAPISNELALKYAVEHSLPMTAGSDAHCVSMLGHGLTEVDAYDLDTALREIKRGRTKIYGKTVDLMTLIRYVRRRGELSREYTKTYVDLYFGPFKPFGHFYLSLLYLPEFFDLAYYVPSWIASKIYSRLMKKSLSQVSGLLFK